MSRTIELFTLCFSLIVSSEILSASVHSSRRWQALALPNRDAVPMLPDTGSQPHQCE